MELPKGDTSPIREMCLNEKGLIEPISIAELKKFKPELVLLFMHEQGIYTFPTTELIEQLRLLIKPSKTIEIGSGIGSIGRALNIPTTDSREQEQPQIIEHFKILKQVPITYPDDIERLEASEAIEKYKPECVLGCYITHAYDIVTGTGKHNAVSEYDILRKGIRYINVGNKITHKHKPLLMITHLELNFGSDIMFNRAVDQSQNYIKIWND